MKQSFFFFGIILSLNTLASIALAWFGLTFDNLVLLDWAKTLFIDGFWGIHFGLIFCLILDVLAWGYNKWRNHAQLR